MQKHCVVGPGVNTLGNKMEGSPNFGPFKAVRNRFSFCILIELYEKFIRL